MATNRSALARSAFDERLRQIVPANASVMATPELYWSPIEAGYRDARVTTWFPEQEDVCGTCYLLMEQAEYAKDTYVLPANLAKRRVLFAGAAFPASRTLPVPVVVLSPEQ